MSVQIGAGGTLVKNAPENLTQHRVSLRPPGPQGPLVDEPPSVSQALATGSWRRARAAAA